MNKNKCLYILIPHRGVAAGKSRLGAVLSAAARSELNRWLLERTLRIASAWLGNTQRCMVVSPCVHTLALAQAVGSTALLECASTQGLNDALGQSVTQVAALGAQQVLILPSDLPRLDGASLQAMAFLSGSHAGDVNMVLAPDRHGTGTNALLVDAGVSEFAFGANSLARHIALAERHGVRALICTNPALAFDLDTPEDFSQWTRSGDTLPPFLAVPALPA